MIVDRTPRTGRAFAGLALAAVLLLAACGGGGSAKDSSTATEPSDADITTTTAAGADGGDGGDGGGKCFTTPGTQTARVRYVNLYSNDTYPQGDIDIWDGFGPTDACGKKLATVPYGTATDYIDVTARDEAGNWETVAFVAGGSDDDKKIITQTQTWKGGEQLTIMFSRGDPSFGTSPSNGMVQVFFERDNETESSALPPVAGKAVVAIGASALQFVVPEDSWVPGIVGQPGCLLGVGDTETSRTNIGGTSLVSYPVTPGSVDIGLYPSQPTTCTGEPDIGPVTIDAAADSRTLVFAYGPDPENIDLMVLPVDD